MEGATNIRQNLDKEINILKKQIQEERLVDSNGKQANGKHIYASYNYGGRYFW